MSMGLHLKKKPITFSDKAIWPSFVLIWCTTIFLDIILNKIFVFRLNMSFCLYTLQGEKSIRIYLFLVFFGINYTFQ
jgi:hypothetical protein